MFQPGNPKPANSGRKAGTPNKAKRLQVTEVLKSNAVNPVQEIIKLLPQLEPYQQVKVYLELLSYCAAKPKADESDEQDMLDVTPEEVQSESTEELLRKLSPK